MHIVDALGDGAYSLSNSELDWQRAGTVTTFSGEEIRPPWVVAVSREIDTFGFTDGRFTFNGEDCDVVQSCTYVADALQSGDLLTISYSLDPKAGLALMDTLPAGVLDEYVRTRTGLSMDDVTAVSPDVTAAFLLRLFNLDVFDELIPYFDSLHALRDKGIPVTLQSHWNSRWLPELCFPDEESQAVCLALEAAAADEEERRIGALRDLGYELWARNWITYNSDSSYQPVGDRPRPQEGSYQPVGERPRPHFSLFDGILAVPQPNDAIAELDIGETLASNVREFATEIGPDMPVIIMAGGPPITSVTSGGGCEAEICPSDFGLAYEQVELWLSAALDSLSTEQFRGFGSALFEGAHFDIREPYEEYSFPLNRVGETGYNHPALNIWRAQ